jgi:SAM-dependent methyltransferase
VGHPLRFTTIAHGDRQILGPMSRARLEGLAGACPLSSGDHVLELGVGKGAFVATLLGRWPGATAEGFDRNPWFLAAARAAAIEAGRDIAARVSFVETDTPGVMFADRSVALTVAMGAIGILGDQQQTVAGLAASTRPGGIVMFADGFWSRLPPSDGLASFGMARDELADGVDGFAALGAEAGLAVEAVDVVDVAEWDDYEGSYAAAVERWAASNPDDPERVTFLERVALMRSSYADWRRDAFGYAIARFRVPA